MIQNTMLCTVSERYLEFLREVDNHVELKAARPYYIIQPEKDGFIYAVPLSQNTKNSFGASKASTCTSILIDPRGKEPVGSLLFQNMIPVPPELLIPIPEERFHPHSLYIRQVRALRVMSDVHQDMAIKTLDSRTRGNNKFLNEIAVDFRLLEKRANFFARSNKLAEPVVDPAPRLKPHLHL